VEALDRTFTTTHSYHVVRLTDEHGQICGFRLDPGDGRSVTKAYEMEPQDGALVAEVDGRIVGYAFTELVDWNRRAVLHDLYVDSSCRGRGVGRALLEAARTAARTDGAHCLWLETQNVNGPAIAFYRRMGFTLVGLDETLYDDPVIDGETAVYFATTL
jgi:ribosomal protein S18 acetylase RimI-like enzyme